MVLWSGPSAKVYFCDRIAGASSLGLLLLDDHMRTEAGMNALGQGAAVLSRINHPNIMRPYARVEHPNKVADVGIFFEYHGNLFEYLQVRN